jgi:hypothetical protein
MSRFWIAFAGTVSKGTELSSCYVHAQVMRCTGLAIPMADID